MPVQRTKNTYQQQLKDFINVIDVVCPSCSGRAIVLAPGAAFENKNYQAIKLVCSKCGYNKMLDEKPEEVLHASAYKVMTGRYLITGGAIDPYFNLPLWLSVDCCDNNFWAYNNEHLDFLNDHVSAKLRERNTQEMANKSIGSRLPKWITSKKNRETILKAIHQLRNKV